ncbi:hypothetical protein GCM10009540_65330 [Streptomyces turgidiscabies]
MLTGEQDRPSTAPETWRFRRRLASAQQQLHPPATTSKRRLAVAGSLELAFALAEPVRRIAQVLAVPHGGDDRLPADEHCFILDELLVPMYVSDK